MFGKTQSSFSHVYLLHVKSTYASKVLKAFWQGWPGTKHCHTIRISLQSKAAASIVSPGNGPRPMLVPKSLGGSGGCPRAGGGQTGFRSPAGSSVRRKVTRLPCVTCHLCCCQEPAFHQPFADEEDLGLSFGTSSVHSSRPNILGSSVSFAGGCRLPSTSGI